MAHILGAEHLWMARLCRRQPALPVWPDLGVEECAIQLDQLSRLWPEYLAGLSPKRLGEAIPYTNSKGESWASTVEEILTRICGAPDRALPIPITFTRYDRGW